MILFELNSLFQLKTYHEFLNIIIANRLIQYFTAFIGVELLYDFRHSDHTQFDLLGIWHLPHKWYHCVQFTKRHHKPSHDIIRIEAHL